MSKNICVDLDGVLAEYNEWKGIFHFGPVIEGAKEFLQKLRDRGFFIVINTCRGHVELNGYTPKYLAQQVENWLKLNDLPYDDVFVGQGKPPAHAYIDDRAIHCNPITSRQYDWDFDYEDVLDILDNDPPFKKR